MIVKRLVSNHVILDAVTLDKDVILTALMALQHDFDIECEDTCHVNEGVRCDIWIRKDVNIYRTTRQSYKSA